MSLSIPSLGHGIGLRPRHFGDFLAGRPDVGWVEVISENHLAPGGRPRAVLHKVPELEILLDEARKAQAIESELLALAAPRMEQRLR